MAPEPEEPTFGDETDTGGPDAGTPERAGIIDAVADLIALFVEYVRQETGDVVRDKVVRPTQKAGQVVAFALAAGAVLSLGVAFVSVAILLVLARFLGWPGALMAVGGVLILGAGGLTYAKTRSMQ